MLPCLSTGTSDLLSPKSATLTTPLSRYSCSTSACRLPLIIRLAGFRSLGVVVRQFMWSAGQQQDSGGLCVLQHTLLQ